MISTYNNGRIAYGTMKDANNGIYLGYYNDKRGVKIGETSSNFTDRWNSISSSSDNGFCGLYYYCMGDHGKNTTLIRKALECIIRRRISCYATNHKKFFNFQGDSFICSREACDGFIEWVLDNAVRFDNYFAKMEEKIAHIVEDENYHKYDDLCQTLASILLKVDDCEEN